MENTQGVSDPVAKKSPDSSSSDDLTKLSLEDLHLLKNEDLNDIMALSGQAVYRWDVATNKISWSQNVKDVLGLSDSSFLKAAGGFNMLVDADYAAKRFKTITESRVHFPGEIIPYQMVYKFYPLGRSKSEFIWIEERGRSYSSNGQSIDHAFGLVSLIRDEEALFERFPNLKEGADKPVEEILTRAGAVKHLSETISRSSVGDSHAFLLAEIRNLRMINDTFGYIVGDELVTAIGKRMFNRMREGDIIGHYSSNKFAIVVHYCDGEESRIAAHRFLQAVRDEVFETSAGPISMTISVGGVIVPDDADNIEKALNAASDALHAAVEQGTDRYVSYAEIGAKEIAQTHNVALANDIVNALNERRIILALQPIVRAKDKIPAHYECLARMQNVDGEIITAAEFIPMAEQLGLNRLIDYRILELTVQALKKFPDISLAVNVSANTISDKDWQSLLSFLVENDKNIAKRLTVEITETSIIEDIEHTQKFVECVKELGCKVAIDDFGAGYTSFRNLKLLDVDIVKIDGEFVRNMDKSQKDQLFVQALHELATSLGMETVAEFVGTKEVSHLLDMIGVHYQQGYLFGKPKILALEGCMTGQLCSEDECVIQEHCAT